jgi:hypothetical protein
MTVTAIVGANWGDEGKGKMTDVLSAESAYVVRYQGGSNAGHTIINEYGKFVLQMLPSGVFNPGVVNVIGPGTALDIRAVLDERQKLLDRGVPERNYVYQNVRRWCCPFIVGSMSWKRNDWELAASVRQDEASRHSMRINMPSWGFRRRICMMRGD